MDFSCVEVYFKMGIPSPGPTLAVQIESSNTPEAP